MDANKAPVFSVECVYELCYRLKEDYKPQADEIEAFKNGNAVFNCWPYFREFFQNLTARMGQTPPPLPLLRIVPKPATPVKPEPNPVKAEAGVTPTEADTRSVARRRRKRSVDR